MSRLCFSNNIEIVNNFVSYCEKAGFNRYNTLAFQDTSGGGAVFKKLKLDNDNFYSDASGSISVVGTFFYKGHSGQAALAGILADFNGDVPPVREKMNGAYACVIIKNGLLYAFGDSSGVYYYYYAVFEETKEWVIGTSLYGLAKASGRCSVDEFNLLEKCFQSQFGDGTLFKDFCKISGDFCVVVNIADNVVEKRAIGKKISIDARDINVIVREAATEYHRLAKVLKNSFGETGISILMTGGLDSRCMMASLLSEGISPAMYYGVGNSPLAPTTEDDLKVDRVYAEKFDLPLHVLDWSMPEKIDVAWDETIEKYGDLGTMYSSSPNVYDSLDEITEPCVLLGYFGEMYRNHSLVEGKKGAKFSLDDILWGYFIHGRDMQKILGDEYEQYVQKIGLKWNAVLEPYLNQGKLDQEYFSIVEFWRRRYSDTLVINFMNQSRFALTLMSEPEILKYAFIPVENKNNAGFMIKLVNELCPEVLSVPIFSRYCYMMVDKEKMEIVPQKMTFKKKAINLVGKWLGWKNLKKIKNRLALGHTFMPKEMSVSQTKEDIVAQVNAILKRLPMETRDIDSEHSDYLSKDVAYAYLMTMLLKLQ